MQLLSANWRQGILYQSIRETQNPKSHTQNPSNKLQGCWYPNDPHPLLKPKTTPDGTICSRFVLFWDSWFHSWICLGFIMVEDFMDLIVAWLYLSPCWCSPGSLLKGGFRNSLRKCILNEKFLIRYCSTAWWWFLASLDGEAQGLARFPICPFDFFPTLSSAGMQCGLFNLMLALTWLIFIWPLGVPSPWTSWNCKRPFLFIYIYFFVDGDINYKNIWWVWFTSIRSCLY